jgi:hypothetical protein
MAIIKGRTRVAVGARLPQVCHATSRDVVGYTNVPPARQLLTWAKPTGEVKLVKVGPRHAPSHANVMAEKLAKLKIYFEG